MIFALLSGPPLTQLKMLYIAFVLVFFKGCFFYFNSSRQQCAMLFLQRNTCSILIFMDSKNPQTLTTPVTYCGSDIYKILTYSCCIIGEPEFVCSVAATIASMTFKSQFHKQLECGEKVHLN